MMRRALLALVVLGLFSTTALAQQQFFKVRIDNISPAFPFSASGVFNTPDGADAPGPLLPGNSYSFSFDAAPGQYLSFATMFVQSNDLFYAPDEQGIPLYNDDGTAKNGDVTMYLQLWDAGTEANEEPGAGVNQAPRQSGPNTGDIDPDNTVRLVNDGYTYPATEEVVNAELTHEGGTRFTLSITNVSTETTLAVSDGSTVPVPMAPGVFVVHTSPAPLFTSGEADRGEGLEGIAEDGAAGMLGDALAAHTGVVGVFAPGVWAVHTEEAPLFTSGQPDRGLGLEALAEDGGAAGLGNALALETVTTGGVFAVPAGAAGPGPLPPGNAYEFTIAATPGAYLSFATMFVQSNDLFIGPDEMGIPLWDDSGAPLEGDITMYAQLWDAGTEANEAPGVGPNQAPRQSGPDTGDADPDNTVRLVNDGYTYPDLAEVVQITIMPLESQKFDVTIENVSDASTLATSDGGSVPVPMAPGVWAVHTGAAPLFTSGQPDRGLGLEGIAEDGAAGDLGAYLAMKAGLSSGIFNTPDGADAPGPLFPENTYSFTVDAAPGAYLSLATMFVQSNDLFYAPDEMGIPFWDENGNPRDGDVTMYLQLWDSGTEANEEPGLGPNQAPRQSGPNTGDADPDNTVRLVDDGYTYPDNASVIKLTITPARENQADGITFTLIDAMANTPVPGYDPIEEGAVLDLSSLPMYLSIRANTTKEAMSVQFQMDGDRYFFVENYEPYSFCRDIEGDYRACDFKPGDYEITATSFTEDGAGGEKVEMGKINVSFVNDGNVVTGFVLVDTETNEDIEVLMDGDTIDLSALPMYLSIRANAGEKVESVRFELSPSDYERVENIVPYALYGDIEGNYLNGTFHTGENVLVATPFSQNRAGGEAGHAQTITFNVTNSANLTMAMAPPTGYFEEAVEGQVNVANEDIDRGLPEAFELGGNYPNPFNPVTTINFNVPEASEVTLAVYDALGRQVSVLIQGVVSAGRQEVQFEAGNLPTGTYFYKLVTPNQSFVRSMLLVK